MKTIFSLLAFMFILSCSNNQDDFEEHKMIDTLRKSITDFPDTLSNDTSSFLFYSDRAKVCIERKHYYEAIEFLNRGKHLAVDKANCYLYLSSVWARIHTKAANDSVFYCIGQAIQIEPKNSIYYFIRSRYFNDLGYNAEALKDIEVAIKYSPAEDRTSYVNQRGIYKMVTGDFKGAVADVKNVAIGNKENIQFLLAQSIIYNQADMHGEALAASKKLIELDSNIAQAYTIRGNALYYLKRKDESIRDFYKARDLGDSTAIEYINRHEKSVKNKH